MRVHDRPSPVIATFAATEVGTATSLLRRLVPIAASIAIAGCTVGPDDELPDAGFDEDTGGGEVVTIERTAGAPLSPVNASCLRLTDTGTWSSYPQQMAGVGVRTTLAGVLTDLNRSGQPLGALRPSAPGLVGGFAWQSDDNNSTNWIPQGLTAGTSGSRNVAIVGWHYDGAAPDKGTRISIADITSPSSVKYRHVLLVEPSGTNNFKAITNHAGGLAWFGNYLFEADTYKGIRVFDLREIHAVSTAADCDDKIGAHAGRHCAYGYKYVLPQVSAFYVPSSVSAACKPVFSFLGRAGNDLLSGEYCKAGGDCDVSPGDGLGGRLYRWSVNSSGRIGATPLAAYYMNEPQVQGVAGVPGSSSYWLSSTARGGALFLVSPSAKAKVFRSENGQWAKLPQGMHATLSGTNLWVATEAARNRVVFYSRQSALK